MKLLICSDGSEQAERALQLGTVLASHCQGEVTLLGIVEARGQSQALLESLKRGHALLEEQHIHTELITRSGEPVEEIRKRTVETAYDLVVIGAVRKAARGMFWVSSSAYQIIKEIQPPVLVVMGGCTTLKRILLCSGGKRYIETAVQLTGRLARCLGASVTLLHVMAQPPALYASLPRMEETVAALLNSQSELGLNLRRDKETLESLGVPVEVRLRRGPVLEQILQETREGNYDLTVTGSAPGSSFRTYILGDISRELVNRSACAVLVARSLEPAPGKRSRVRRWL
jgi:nucleotide-binding universal stress UspA family protein